MSSLTEGIPLSAPSPPPAADTGAFGHLRALRGRGRHHRVGKRGAGAVVIAWRERKPSSRPISPRLLPTLAAWCFWRTTRSQSLVARRCPSRRSTASLSAVGRGDLGRRDGGKGRYAHFMLKEIQQQPQAVADPRAGWSESGAIDLPDANSLRAGGPSARRVPGLLRTSYMRTDRRSMVERLSGFRRADLASEFAIETRCSDGHADRGHLAVWRDRVRSARQAPATGGHRVLGITMSWLRLAREADA